jgi:hypothetical protein
MPTLANIVENVHDKKHVKKMLYKFATEVIKELNRLVPFGFELEHLSSDVLRDHYADLNFDIGTEYYHFSVEMYAWPGMTHFTIYELKEYSTTSFGTKADLSTTMTPKEVAIELLRYIDPVDLVKAKKLKRMPVY